MNLGISFFNLTHLYREVKYKYVRSRHALLKALTRPFLGFVLNPKSNYTAPQRPEKIHVIVGLDPTISFFPSLRDFTRSRGNPVFALSRLSLPRFARSDKYFFYCEAKPKQSIFLFRFHSEFRILNSAFPSPQFFILNS